MNRISISKNFTKKIAIFFLVFFVFVSLNIKSSNAEILKFGFGADITTCKDALVNCKIDSSLKKDAVANPNYYLANTLSNITVDLTKTDYKVTDFNISIDNLIKERLYTGDTGYFGNKIDKNFNYFDNDFTTFGNNVSANDKKNLDLLFKTMGSNVGTQDMRLAIAKNVTKNLANMTASAFYYEDLQVATLTFYYLKIYKVLDQYLIINKSVLSTDTQIQLDKIKNTLRENIYKHLYKTDSIIRADGCTTDGTNLEKCDLFISGKFQINAIDPADDLSFNVMSDVNNLKLDALKYDANANNVKIDTSIVSADPNTRNDYADRSNATCDPDVGISNWFLPTKSTAGCSFMALMVNYIIQMINGLVNIIVNLASALFDWIYNIGVINFKSWVDGSGAYTIYKTIILSLIVSVMTFFVFYLIIRRLIDDDGEKMNKILPGLILTALFVYFSFTITGWIIDQSNIITIYLYRSMTNQDGAAQSIGEVFKRILSLDNGGANAGVTGIGGNFGISLGSWNAIPFTVGQLVVSIVGVFVLFEGAILILSRTIILLLCMIFSPLMLLPDGLTDFTDKYKKLVMDNFTGNVLLGPVFMFLVLLAVQIGQATTKWMTNNSPSFDNAGVNAVPTNFLGGIISSVLVIVVLQLAISASKSLSGSAGEKLGGVISKYAGGAAFGGGASILRNTIGRGAAVAKDKGWMMGKEGSARHKFMSTLYNGASKSTFDARNTDTFKRTADFSGAGANSFGQGSNKNYNDSFKRKLYNANQYHGGLDEGGKQRNIDRLKNLGSAGDIDSKRIADSLEKKWKPSINERLNNDSEYNKRFDKATAEKDEAKRKGDIEKVINEHFKENGQGAEHFSKEISKPENNKIKQDYDKALTEKDPVKRKEALTKVIADLDKKTENDSGSIASLTESLEKTNSNNNSSNQNTNSGPKPSQANRESMNSLRSRLQAKYSKQDVNENRQKRMTMYQEKTLKEEKEKQDTEIATEKEKNGGFIPSAKDLDAQSSLKDRLKEKYNKEDVADYRKNQENNYQNKVLEEAQMKANVNYSNNPSSNSNDNKGPELSNSSVSNNPPVITVDTGAGNKIDIPLTKEDGKPNIIQGDTKVFSEN